MYVCDLFMQTYINYKSTWWFFTFWIHMYNCYSDYEIEHDQHSIFVFYVMISYFYNFLLYTSFLTSFSQNSLYLSLISFRWGAGHLNIQSLFILRELFRSSNFSISSFVIFAFKTMNFTQCTYLMIFYKFYVIFSYYE